MTLDTMTAGTVGGAIGLNGIVGAALAGAAGAVASQLVGKAIGAQDEFSWKNVALSAVSAGVTAGAGGAIAGANITAGFARAAISDAMTQGIGLATGLQDQFSWAAVAASAAGAQVGASVADGMNSALNGSGLDAFSQRLVTGTAAGLAAGTVTNVMHGGRVAVQQIAADAFGSALGSSIAEAMQPTADSKYSLAAPGTELGSGSSSVRFGTGDNGASISYADASDPVGIGGYNSDQARQLGLVASDAGPALGEGPYADAGPAIKKANVFGNVPMRDWSDNSEPGPRRATDPAPGSNHDEVVRRVSAGAANEGELRLALDEQEAAAHAAAEKRYGLAGALRGLNQFGADTVRTPYYAYTSLRDNGPGGTATLVLEGLVDTPSTLYAAYSSGDMQTLTAAGLGTALGMKVPGGGRLGALAERSVARLGEDVAGTFYKVESGGVRGELPLSLSQHAQVENYLSKFDLTDVQVRWVDDTNLSTGYMHGNFVRALNIGSDVVPGNVGLGTLTANSRISLNGTLAHELVGHREAALAGMTQDVVTLEEAQASIRAARFGPDLTSTERYTLLRDAVTRLHSNGLRVRDVRDLLYIEHR